MPLSTGDKPGPCEIVSLPGAGDMGVVYKSRDAWLDRIVAVQNRIAFWKAPQPMVYFDRLPRWQAAGIGQ